MHFFIDNISLFRYSITTIFFVVYMNTLFVSDRFETLLKILTGKNYRNNLKQEFIKRQSWLILIIPAKIYLFKVNNRNTRRKCKICSKLTIKTPERHHWCRSYFTPFSRVSIVDFEQVNTSWVSYLLFFFFLFKYKFTH